ncbi:MAG: hypothetical protein ACYC9Z_15655 [Casimicrobiaceae bacterium]
MNKTSPNSSAGTATGAVCAVERARRFMLIDFPRPPPQNCSPLLPLPLPLRATPSRASAPALETLTEMECRR